MRATVPATSSIARWMITMRAARSAEVRLAFQQRFGIQRHRRNRVVDVVRDAARHLAERAQPLLLHHGVLGLLQIVVGLLQRAVELRLVRGQRDVLAELPQEFAFPAAERCGSRRAATSTPKTWPRPAAAR